MLKDELSRIEHVSALADYFGDRQSKDSIVSRTDAGFICIALRCLERLMFSKPVHRGIVELSNPIERLKALITFFEGDDTDEFIVGAFDAGIIYVALKYLDGLMNDGLLDPAGAT